MQQLLINCRAGFRANTTRALVVVGILVVIVSMSLGSLSARQPATLMLDFGFSILRIVLCLMALVWLQELLGRAIERRFIHQLLVFPQARYRILLTALISIALMLLLTVVVFALLLLLGAKIASTYVQATMPSFGLAYWVTWIFIYLDVMVVAVFSLLVLMVSTTPYFSVLLGFAFYVAGHSLSSIVDILVLSPYADASHTANVLPLLKGLRYIVPDLNAFDVRDWSLYGESLDVERICFQLAAAAVYMSILFVSASILFYRREFS